METLRYNYYDILEVSPHCAQHEVTTAYERARITYSGENPAIYTIFSENEARDLLKLVEEAYQVLGNKTLRALYDEKISKGNNKYEDISFETLKAQSKILVPDIKRNSNVRPEYKQDEEFESDIKSRTDWQGPSLRAVREYKKIPLDKLSEITKISGYYINAIEMMEPQNLPALVYVRGYVSQLCKVLSLDEKQVCDSYMKAFKDKLGKI